MSILQILFIVIAVLALIDNIAKKSVEKENKSSVIIWIIISIVWCISSSF